MLLLAQFLILLLLSMRCVKKNFGTSFSVLAAIFPMIMLLNVYSNMNSA